MQIESVNLGRVGTLRGPRFDGPTGIFKTPVQGSVEIGEFGLTGDAIIDTKHHGGPDQAVYVYRSEDYEWWSEMLGETVEAGTFGENLTIRGLPSADMAIGTRLVFNQVVLEASAPRIPCNTLAQRMGSATFAREFMRAERPGIYCRVITPGSVTAGESFQLDDSRASEVTVLEMFRAEGQRLTRQALERFLGAPIDIRTRTKWEAALAKLG